MRRSHRTGRRSGYGLAAATVILVAAGAARAEITQTQPTVPQADSLPMGTLDFAPLDKAADDLGAQAIAGAGGKSSVFSFDYSFPESPALMLAGLGSSKITPQTSLKPFVLALPGLIDGSSGVSAAALDASLLLVLGQDPDALDHAKPGNYFDRLLSRSRLGVALTRGDDGGGDATKQKPSRIAFALSFSLADDADPLVAGGPKAPTSDGDKSAWAGCVKANVPNLSFLRTEEARNLAALNAIEDNDPNLEAKVRHVVDDGSADGTRERLADERRSAVSSIRFSASDLATFTDCKAVASAAAEHGNDLKIGFGGVWGGTPGKWAGFTDANFALWVAGRLSLDNLFKDHDPPKPLSPTLGPLASDPAVRAYANVANKCTKEDNRPIGERLLSCWMIGGSGRYSIGEMVATGNAAHPLFKANTLEGWIGIERVTNQMKLGAYVGYVNQAAADAAEKPFGKSGTRWLISGAISLDSIVGDVMEGAWLVGSYGAANGSVSTLDDKVAMLTLTMAPPKIDSGFQSGSGNGGK